MMHLTHLVRLLAREESTPIPGSFPPLRVADTPHNAPDLESELAARTGEAARHAAILTDHPGIGALCRDVAGFCTRLSDWTPETPHPAVETNPPAFQSFDRTYAKYVAAD